MRFDVRAIRLLLPCSALLFAFNLPVAAIPPPNASPQVVSVGGGPAVGGSIDIQATVGQSIIGTSAGGSTGFSAGYFGPPLEDNDWTTCGLNSGNSYLFNRTSKITAGVAIAGTLDCLQVKRTDAPHPNALAGMDPAHYWTLVGTNSAGGAASSFSLSLTFPQPNLLPPGPYACRQVSGMQWSCSRSSATTTTVTRDGVTALSDWTVGTGVCLTDAAGPTVTAPGAVTATQTVCQ